MSKEAAISELKLDDDQGDGRTTAAQLTAAELLEQAYKEAEISTELVFTIKDQQVRAYLEPFDILDIQWQQTEIRDEVYEDCVKKGWDKRPINKKLWQETLKAITDPEQRKDRQKNPPKNLAEQYAEGKAGLYTILQLISTRLKDEQGNPRFPTYEHQQMFFRLVLTNPALFTMIISKYNDLQRKASELISLAKN